MLNHHRPINRVSLATGTAFLLTLSLLTGCTNQTATSAPAVEPADPAVIARLLATARAAEQEQHLIEPFADSAIDYYRQVLALEANNADAMRGIEAITEAYANKARQAADRQQYNQAWLELDRARRSDAQHPTIKPTESYLQLQERSRRYRVQFSQRELQAKRSETKLSLKTLGEQAMRPDCRATITSANDAQGRWMYQQMKRAQGPARLRAQLQTGAPSAVAVQCF